MSYILDALRRADAERARQTVPGVLARQVPEPAPIEAPRRSGMPWPWVAALILGAGVAVPSLVWWLGSGPRPAAAPVAVDPPPPASAVIRHDPAPAQAVVPASPPSASAADLAPATSVAKPQLALPPDPVVAAPPPARPPAVAPGARPAAGNASTGPVPPVATAPAPAPEPALVAAARARSPVPVTPAPAPEGGAATAARVFTFDELPPEIRSTLPSLQVGGSVYSDNANTRMLILNSQLFHEGDEVHPGLVLQQIRPKSAVLSIKGYRYQIGY